MFSEVVNLYRLLGKPDLGESNVFEKSISYSQDVANSLALCSGFSAEFGNFYASESDGLIHIEAEFPQNESCYFFSSIEDFVAKAHSICDGEFRDNFYITNIDYSSEDKGEDPVEISNLKNISRFVKNLRVFSSITIDVDNKIDGGGLLFLKALDGRSSQQASLLKINIKPSFAKLNIKKYEILDYLVKSRSNNRPHIEEKVLLMNAAISDLISECSQEDDEFEYLLRNWSRVRRKYYNDLKAYVNGFSFDAIRKKISDSVIDSTTKINNTISELGTKILGVPLALGALIALYESGKSGYSFWMGIFGVLIAALIINRTIIHYEAQLVNLIKTFDFNFEVSLTARRSFSRSILNELERIENELLSQRKRVEKTIAYYKFFSLLPFLFCAILIFYKNISFVQDYWEFLMYLLTFLMLIFCSKDNS